MVSIVKIMMTSSNGSIFRITGPLCGESSGHQWIPLTKASDAELLCFLWSAPEQTVEQTIETPVIWDGITLIMTSLSDCGENWRPCYNGTAMYNGTHRTFWHQPKKLHNRSQHFDINNTCKNERNIVMQIKTLNWTKILKLILWLRTWNFSFQITPKVLSLQLRITSISMSIYLISFCIPWLSIQISNPFYQQKNNIISYILYA